MGLRSIVYFVLWTGLLVLANSCIEEVELDTKENVSYFIIDGEIVIAQQTQRVFIGRTDGVATARPLPISGASIMVENYTDGTQHFYRELGSGDYVSSFEGQMGKDYQLFITFESGAIYKSDTVKLIPAPELVFSGNVDATIRRNENGDSIVTDKISAIVDFQVPSTTIKDFLILRSSFEYAISDIICDPFDNADICYYKADIDVDRLSLIDLSIYSGGSTGSFQIGSYGIDARMAEESIIIVDISRVDENARPYYRSVASAISLGGNFFSPQPFTIPGNVFDVRGVNNSILGYFGVIEKKRLVLPANSAEIILQSGLPLCRGGLASLRDFDCCYCERNNGAVTTRPVYWP